MFRVMSKVSHAVDSLEGAFLAFSDEFDRFITIVRNYAVYFEVHGEPEIYNAYRDAAIAATAGVIALSAAGAAAKQVQADDKSELLSTYYLLYRIQRELDKMVQCVKDQYNAIENEEIKQTYQKFFNELGCTEELADPEAEFYNLQKYIYHFNPSVSFPRRLSRRMLAAMGLGKDHGHDIPLKSYQDLQKNADHYKAYVGQLHEKTAVTPEALPKHVPSFQNKANPLNAWEKWFSVIFLISENEYENEPGLLGAAARTYGKMKRTFSDAWDTLGNYSLFYWVGWGSIWAIAGAATVASTLATALTLSIPAIPATIFFIKNLFKGKEDKAKLAAQKAQAAANEIFFAKSYVQMLRYSYEKIYAARLKLLQKQADEGLIQFDGKGKNKIASKVIEQANDPNFVKTALNAQHASFKQVWKHVKALRIIDALSLSVRLTWAKARGKPKHEVAYQSPAEAALARLDSQFGKNRNIALSAVSGFFNGAIGTAFVSWPITTLLVFAGVSAAGGPLAQLICFAIAGAVGVFIAVKQATAASIEAKRQQAVIDKYRPDVIKLIEAEKKSEYLRMQLKDGYKEILSLSDNQRDAQLFKPVLPIKNLATADRFYRRKTSENSMWTPVKKFMNRLYHTVASAETGILFARFLVCAGGVVPLIGHYTAGVSLGSSIPIAVMASVGLVYGGMRLHEYCLKKQRERDMKIVENAHARLEVVNASNEMVEQQLLDQQTYRATLNNKMNAPQPRIAVEDNSVAVMMNTLSDQPAPKAEARQPTASTLTPFKSSPKNQRSIFRPSQETAIQASDLLTENSRNRTFEY